MIENNLPDNFQLLEYPIEHERSSRKVWLKITIFAINSPFLLPFF